MQKTAKNKLKSIFSLRNIAIAICILVIIIVVVILIFEPDFNKNAEQQATIASTSQNDSNIPQNNQEPEEQNASEDNKDHNVVQNNNSGKKISEEDAKKLALRQFNELGEKDLNESELKIKTIKRSGELYYHVASQNNTIEIKIETGEITRINTKEV